MRKFKSAVHAQRFVTAHAEVSNLFNLDRHLVGTQYYRDLRVIALEEYGRAVT
jgi:putative transposase